MNLNIYQRIRKRVTRLSLKAKAFLITATVLLLIVLCTGLGLDYLIRESFSSLEKEWIKENAHMIRKLLIFEADSMQRITHDYSVWTDTYNYISSSDPSYLKTNFTAEVFKNLQIYGAFIYFPDGRRKTGFILNRAGDSLTIPEPGWDIELGVIARKVVSGEASFLNGLIQKDREMFLISTHQILRDQGIGPPRGCFIHVRKIDSSLLKRLSDITGITINLVDLSSEEVSAVSGAQGNGYYFFTEASAEIINLYIVLKDIHSNIGGVVVSTFRRDINLESRRARMMFYMVLAFILAASVFLAHYMLNRLVIARLGRMIAEVRSVRDTMDLSKRLRLQEWDELDDLAAGINLMLDAIEEQKKYRDMAEAEKEAMQEYMLQLKKMEAMGTLAGGIAHDFNNMLGSILGSASLLRQDLPPASSLIEYVDIIEKSGQNAGALVRQMLTLGKGYTSLKIYFSVGQTISDMLSLVRVTIPENIIINVHNEEREDLVYADITQFQQVVINLVTNASHAMAGKNRGNLDIFIREVILPCSNPRPETLSLGAGRYLQIEFSDNGSGIPEEIKGRIFEPFFSTRPAGSGTGLGLSVVYQFVVNSGGCIGVESEPSKGTSFIIHLPSVQERRKNKTLPGGEKISVLLVDDDLLVRKTMIAGLKRMGYYILDAASGQSALKIVEEHGDDIQLVITDQMMPGMSGKDLCRRISAICPYLPVILISGYTSGLEDGDDEKSCFAKILMKPVAIERLDKIISEVLGKQPV